MPESRVQLYKGDWRKLLDRLRAAEQRAERARQEALEDKQDAARYRYLKAHHLRIAPDAWIRTGDDLDEATDEGISALAQKERK